MPLDFADIADDDTVIVVWQQFCLDVCWVWRRIRALTVALRQTMPWPVATGSIDDFGSTDCHAVSAFLDGGGRGA